MALIPKDKIQGGSVQDYIRDWHQNIRALEIQTEATKSDPSATSILSLYRIALNAQNNFNNLAAAGMTAAVLGPYMNSYFGILDWSIYEVEYEALRTTDLPALITWIAGNTSLFTVSAFDQQGNHVWSTIDATALLPLLDNILARFV